jgi:peroxiredoxin
MRTRWIIAVVAVLGLVSTTLVRPSHWFRGRLAPGTQIAGVSPAVSHARPSCGANAKPANLDFTLKDMNDAPVKLADFKGKVIVLDFWATWCGPCKLEIPGFVELQHKYGKEGLQVIGVSVDDKLEQLKPFVDEFRMDYPVLQGLGHDDMQDAYGPMWGIPTTVLIGRDGRICGRHTGMSSKDVFEQEIKALL